MTDNINGWMPPLVYDVSTDTKRIATQDDIDLMERNLRMLGQFYADMKRRIQEMSDAFRSDASSSS